MKILERGKAVKVAVEHADDLWYVQAIIDAGDIVSGSTTRKIKLGEGTDRNQKVIKKQVFLSIVAEKIDFHKFSSHLRISGKVRDGPEDIPHGSYHTFDVDEGTILTIAKEEWPQYQLKKLEESAKQKKSHILICVLDRNEAHFALLKRYGYELLSSLQGDVQRKMDGAGDSESFYTAIIRVLTEYNERHALERIIVASPAFFKDDLMQYAGVLGKKILLATCSSGDEAAIVEVMKRPELRSALLDDRTAEEFRMIEELLAQIAKVGLAVYGHDQTIAAIQAGQVESLFVTDGLIHRLRMDDKFQQVESAMRIADSMKAQVHIINSDNDGGKKLDGLGGIGAILRYRISY